ncbi:phosphoesterase RecJ domain-containing protein [Granulicella rosea]|uniref:Phosphoesterase RecJ domain-containing protein n=1 Tax=Granulicella rosea TaxID=474952 RepID=A0A239KBG2_9BACT|nr:bifunctional oligoribonuclease/PAP phosphatase NrnA [Granulicella rosea]SNT15042.1 phosphoesterase RecJ domain-containing protein [Granulicella rosea]
MTAPAANLTEAASIATLLATFRAHPHFILTSHLSPDGDAIGSVLGLAGLLEQMGATTECIFADPIPAIYRTLPGVDRIRHASAALHPTAPAILLECDVARCGLKDLDGRLIVNIDHHASARPFGAINWIDDSACAVGAMVCRIVQAAMAEDPSIVITPGMATCLYTAILTDTGSFTYAATDARTFEVAHELIQAGASPHGIARDVYFSNPFSKLRLLGTALRNLKREGPFAWTTVTQPELDEAGASTDECEGIVNFLIGIDGIEAAFFLREMPDEKQIRASLRSKSAIDVARIAEQFGGGGHRVASGCTLPTPIPEATESILSRLRARLD